MAEDPLPWPYPKDIQEPPVPRERPDALVQEMPPDLPDEDLHPPVDEGGRPVSEDDEVVRPIDGDRDDRDAGRA